MQPQKWFMCRDDTGKHDHPLLTHKNTSACGEEISSYLNISLTDTAVSQLFSLLLGIPKCFPQVSCSIPPDQDLAVDDGIAQLISKPSTVQEVRGAVQEVKGMVQKARGTVQKVRKQYRK